MKWVIRLNESQLCLRQRLVQFDLRTVISGCLIKRVGNNHANNVSAAASLNRRRDLQLFRAEQDWTKTSVFRADRWHLEETRSTSGPVSAGLDHTHVPAGLQEDTSEVLSDRTGSLHLRHADVFVSLVGGQMMQSLCFKVFLLFLFLTVTETKFKEAKFKMILYVHVGVQNIS